MLNDFLPMLIGDEPGFMEFLDVGVFHFLGCVDVLNRIIPTINQISRHICTEQPVPKFPVSRWTRKREEFFCNRLAVCFAI